jgi:predicted nucleotidyltransferase
MKVITKKEALSIARELDKKLREIIPDYTMRLFGSYARDKGRPDSDIDIYIEIPQKYFSDEIKNKAGEIAWLVGFSHDVFIQLNVYSDKEIWETPRRSSPFIKSILKEGIPI